MPNVSPSKPLLDNVAVANATVKRYRLTSMQEIVSSFQLCWHDATSAFTYKVFVSNDENPPVNEGGALDLTLWAEETALAGTVAAAAAGSKLVHLGNNGARDVMVEITTTAASKLSIKTNGKLSAS